MNAMLLNLGLVKIPPTPKLPQINNGLLAMWRRKKQIRRDRGRELVDYMRQFGKPISVTEICDALEWQRTKAHKAMQQLREKGKVRMIGIGRSARWEYCGKDAGK
jgi:diketogulonate reductase-like aldo/keto reductase